MKNPEEREFLLAQREKGRRGDMGSAHIALNLKEKRKQRRNEEYKRIKEAQQEQTLMDNTVLLTALEDSIEEIADGVSAQYPVHAEPTKNKKEDVQESSNFQPRKNSKKDCQP